MFGRFAKILVVDDSAVQRKIMRGLLNSLGYDNIDEAADGRAALAMMQNHSYRFVLSDWDMAPMNGLDLLYAIRADPRFKRIPFVMATAQSQKRFMTVARDSGITHYLLKPFTAAQLGQLIARIGAAEFA